MEHEEFEKVFWELRPRLIGYARGQLDEGTAYDVVAATFETLWKKDLAYPGDDQGAWRRLTSLIYEILKGHVSNEYRSRRRRTSLWRRLAVHHPGDDVCPDSFTEVNDSASVMYWLGMLTEGDRHVIALCNDGYSTEEIAEVLGCSVVAATRRRARAKERLRTIVVREGWGASS